MPRMRTHLARLSVTSLLLLEASCNAPKTASKAVHTPAKVATTIPCEHAVLTGPECRHVLPVDEYPDAKVGTMGEQEARRLMQDFPALLEEHITNDPRNGLRPYDDDVMRMYRGGEYVVQIVPFNTGGRRLAHVHLTSTSHHTADDGSLTDYWRSRYTFISDGGYGNTFILIHLDAGKVLWAFVSGSG